MPSPKLTLRWLLFSPVPSQTILESRGSTATAPREYDPARSKIGVKVLPRLSVFHRPPTADATYQTLGFFGSTATSAIRPDVRPGPIERKEKSLNASLLSRSV